MSVSKETKLPRPYISQIIMVENTTDWKVATTVLDLAGFPVGGTRHSRTKTDLSIQSEPTNERLVFWHRDTIGEDSMSKAGKTPDLMVAEIHEDKAPFKPTGQYLIELNPQYIEPSLVEQIPHIIQGTSSHGTYVLFSRQSKFG